MQSQSQLQLSVHEPSPSIVVVEDDPHIASMLRTILESRGWEVRTACTIKQAHTLLDSRPDWMILDLMLPDGDGEEILGRVRELGKGIQVVVLTASGDQTRLGAIRALGPRALLQKPVDMSDLLEALQGPGA